MKYCVVLKDPRGDEFSVDVYAPDAREAEMMVVEDYPSPYQVLAVEPELEDF